MNSTRSRRGTLRNEVRKLLVENLEGRRLLTASGEQVADDLAAVPAVEAPAFSTQLEPDILNMVLVHHWGTTAESLVENFFANFEARANAWVEPDHGLAKLSRFSSAADAQAALERYVDSYWSSIFGRELTQDMIGIVDYALIAPRMLSVSSGGIAFDSLATSPASSGLTNVQIDGIDEGDAIEVVGGEYLITRSTVDRSGVLGSRIEIVDIRDPSQMKIVGSIEARGYQAQLILSGNRLVAASSTSVQVFDIADKSAPRLVLDAELDSQIQALRLVDGQLVLQTYRDIALPRPLFYPSGIEPGLGYVEGDVSYGRFESRTDYLSRVAGGLLEHFLPTITYQGAEAASGVAGGDWQDLTVGKGALTQQSTVLVFDIQATEPQLLDSESILGTRSDFVFAGSESIYVVDTVVNGWWGNNATFEASTDMYRISLKNEGAGMQAVADAAGTVNGSVLNSRAMDEAGGDLRVVSQVQLSGNDFSTDVHVLRADNAGKLSVVGSLLDIADGQAHFGTNFQGNLVFVTTAEVVNGLILLDPLHVVDLSDPGAPLELSELVIPGVSNHLQFVGPNLLLGIGFEELVRPDRNDSFPGLMGFVDWRLQISLYDVSDRANPKTIDTLVFNDIAIFSPRIALDALGIQYDAESKVLTIADGLLAGISTSVGVLAIEVNPTATEPLKDLGRIRADQPFSRGFVSEGTLFGVTETGVFAKPLADLSRSYPYVPLGRGTFTDYVYATSGVRSSLDVLLNDRLPDGSKITSVSKSQLGATVEIARDGKTLNYLINNSTPSSTDDFTYTVTMPDGSTSTATVVVYIQHGTFLPWGIIGNDSNVQIGVTFVNDAGGVVPSAEVGERLWLELTANEDGPGRGIFSGSFGVQFDPTLLRIIDQPQTLGTFDGQVTIVPRADGGGYEQLSAISTSIAPTGDGPHRIFRFQVEVLREGPIEVIATPALDIGKEFLIYDESGPVRNEKIASGSALLMAGVVAGEAGDTTDVNRDGRTDPLDILWIINFLNSPSQLARSATASDASTSAMGVDTIELFCDVNGDGVVAPLDILQIVNRLNVTSRTTGGEGEPANAPTIEDALPSAAKSVDQVLIAYDWLADLRKR